MENDLPILQLVENLIEWILVMQAYKGRVASWQDLSLSYYARQLRLQDQTSYFHLSLALDPMNDYFPRLLAACFAIELEQTHVIAVGSFLSG
jgi:hypothetical protein